jgi:7-keto-8-aminopelargonate synthetase-like enzyme
VVDEPERRKHLWQNQRRFVTQLTARGLTPLSTCTPIVPVHVGDEAACRRVAAGMRVAGFHVDAIMFPAIAAGQSRLRFILNAHHTAEQIDAAIEVLRALIAL